MVEWQLETDPSHFEVRNTFAEYGVVLWEHYKELLVDHVNEARLGEIISIGRSSCVNSRLPRELRNRAWRALPSVFIQGFEPFVRFDDTDKLPRNKLEYECFMWWDVCSYYPGAPSVEPIDNDYFLEVCRRCLASQNYALHESALHGLGHSIGILGGLQESVEVIDQYLRTNPNLPRRLKKYAKSARNGRVP